MTTMGPVIADREGFAMWLESKFWNCDRISLNLQMFLRSAAPWCLAATLVALPATKAAHAGPLAPQPRVIAKYERGFLERSGSQTLQELLNTGIIRYFLTGGQSLLVLVNGRPYATTAGDLDTLPISVIERIELLGGDSLGALGGSAVRGALNVVLRKDLDGFETRALARMPSRPGGDGYQGSAFWGGAVGKGRLTLGVDILKRQEIAARSRDHSRSVWQKDGAFVQSKNVSVGGNTVWIVQRDEDENVTGVRSVALGECDPARGYTGPLSNPPGIRSGDKGCGFAFGNIMWNTTRDERKTAVLDLDHPLGEDAKLRIDAIVQQGDSAFRYAPSVGSFAFTPNPTLLAAINAAAGTTVADNDDLFAVAHRFVRHGNRDWRTKTEEYDVSLGVEGRLTGWLGYDVRLSAFRFDGFVSGNTFVRGSTIASEIAAGNYNLADPFSTEQAHLDAIRNSSLRLENDVGAEFQGIRLALEGSGFAIGGRSAAWSAGIELGRAKSHDVTVYRDRAGVGHDVSDVLGSGGANFALERKAVGAFGEMFLPLAETVDLRLAGTQYEYDDVGRLRSWSVSSEYRPVGILALRGSWSKGDRAPSALGLYSSEVQDHPYITCDPGTGSPPRRCEQPNPRQVTRVTRGNPKLEPSDTARLAFGAEVRKRPYFLGVEWYRLTRSGLVGRNRADWAMQNLEECTGDDMTGCIDRTGGDITIRDGYANVVDSEITGVTTRFGGGFRTSWGIVGMRGAWRHVAGAKLSIAGQRDRYAIARNMVRAGFLVRRGSLSVVWTSNYRSGFRNSAGTGTFKSWLGHDAVLDWKAPLGLNGARLTAGVFNITDAALSVDTANPDSVDGPTEAGWGRTFFFTFNAQF